MSYFRSVLFAFVILLNEIAFAGNSEEVFNPSQCVIRCKKEACQANPELAKSCLVVCKRTTFYHKIEQMCGNQEKAGALLQTKPLEPISEAQSYKEKREAEKAKEFATALSKGHGTRLADITIGEVHGLLTNEGIDESSGKLSSKGIFMVLQHVNIISSVKNAEDADKALKIRKGQTGTYSDQIYIVSVAPTYLKSPELVSTYVIKGLKEQGQVSGSKENTPQKEMQDLEKVKNFIVPQLQGTNVHIAASGGACWYFDSQNKKRYLVVLTAASGKSLEDWANQYIEGSIDLETWKKIMKSVGASVGELHYTLAEAEAKNNFEKGVVDWNTFKTTPHRDLHGGNVFFKQPNEVKLIDTASMADSLNEKTSPLKDLGDLYLKTKYLRFFNNAKGFQWLNEGFKAFIDGYVLKFPPKSQGALREAILHKYEAWSQAILRDIRENGFTAYQGHDDLLTEILGNIIRWSKLDGLNPEQVVHILETDDMTNEGKGVELAPPHLVSEARRKP